MLNLWILPVFGFDGLGGLVVWCFWVGSLGFGVTIRQDFGNFGFEWIFLA